MPTPRSPASPGRSCCRFQLSYLGPQEPPVQPLSAPTRAPPEALPLHERIPHPQCARLLPAPPSTSWSPNVPSEGSEVPLTIQPSAPGSPPHTASPDIRAHLCRDPVSPSLQETDCTLRSVLESAYSLIYCLRPWGEFQLPEVRCFLYLIFAYSWCSINDSSSRLN